MILVYWLLADAICEGKLTIHYEVDLRDNLLGLKGTVAAGRILSSSHCHLINLSRCELSIAGNGLLNTNSLTLDDIELGDTVMIRDVGLQLCQMPQNSTIIVLSLDGNSFTGEGIHLLADFMCLCPALQTLCSNDYGIISCMSS